MSKKIVVSGIKPTGMPHLGNYLGMIRLGLQLAEKDDHQTLYFIADYHALTTTPMAKHLVQHTYEVAATWLALGLDPERVIFYRQSDLPEILELAWMLSCITKKGLMNIAHAYKAMVAQNQEKGQEDLDVGVNMGLYNYPILMAADVLLFQADYVPVGKDQLQHIEIMRDLAAKFNQQHRSALLREPQALVHGQGTLVPGLDGRKMSKSYSNTIPLFVAEAKLRKLIGQIQTDSTPPHEPKDPHTSSLFQLYREFATPQQVQILQEHYQRGISWKEVKEMLFQQINQVLQEPRERYQELMADVSVIEEILQQGAQQARTLAQPLLVQLRHAVGLRP